MSNFIDRFDEKTKRFAESFINEIKENRIKKVISLNALEVIMHIRKQSYLEIIGEHGSPVDVTKIKHADLLFIAEQTRKLALALYLRGRDINEFWYQSDAWDEHFNLLIGLSFHLLAASLNYNQEKLDFAFEQCRSFCDDKGNDYSPFNLFSTGTIGVLARINDKTFRIYNLISGCEQKVKTESIVSTIGDLVNYAVYCNILRADKWLTAEEKEQFKVVLSENQLDDFCGLYGLKDEIK